MFDIWNHIVGWNLKEWLYRGKYLRVYEISMDGKGNIQRTYK